MHYLRLQARHDVVVPVQAAHISNADRFQLDMLSSLEHLFAGGSQSGLCCVDGMW